MATLSELVVEKSNVQKVYIVKPNVAGQPKSRVAELAEPSVANWLREVLNTG